MPSSASKAGAKDEHEEPKMEIIELEHKVHLKLGKILQDEQ